ncbi:MAG: DUF4440 domain-containing protein [Alphaproteobacteria bacterium]|jgi:hypothetical protein|nr:DUF4440 domain-containing protein [Alphaproteobacteria bacterium]
MRILATLSVIALIALSSTANAQTTSCGTKADIEAAYGKWVAALSSGKPENINALYDARATMQPTLLADANTPAVRADYFQGLMKNPNLKATPQTNSVLISCPVAISTGTYTFSFGEKGAETSIPARFTFVYEKTPQGWMIINHHSSKLPK